MADEPKAEEKPRSRIKLVFVGVRQSMKNDMMYVFHKIMEDGITLEKESRSYSKLKNIGCAGSIWSVEVSPDQESTIYTNTMKYEGMWGSTYKVVEWQALSDAAITAIGLERRKAKETSNNEVFECLEPLRKAYAKAVGRERQILLAQVVEYVTRRS